VEFISKKRLKLQITGIVQGVGFRPFVYKRANELNLVGHVLNDGHGVVVEIEGSAEDLEKFISGFELSAPPLSRIDSINIQELKLCNEKDFKIINSSSTFVNTMVSSDISTCDDCLDEMNDENNRRYNYPFINCTNCGPRYTIINKLPYDRANTSMDKFFMCEECEKEYNNPNDRRYHAQPISCYKCGPKLSIVELCGEISAKDDDAIKRICKLIKDGKSVGIKGLGGFHIVCDATNEDAVNELRKNKCRPSKPLAVMFKDIDSIQKVCHVSKREKKLILSRERPIVVVDKKESDYLADSIAPNIDRIGVFLPYTPVHYLLLNELQRPIVATSANLSDEPIITDEVELLKKLPLVLQTVLTHNRDILNASDDSVVMRAGDITLMIRMARGYAPKSLHLNMKTHKKVLALGANQKNTMTLAFDDKIIISPHIGDLNSLEAFEYFTRTLETFKRFYNFEPDVIVCDKHPNYETTKWARNYIQKHENIELIELQHHYAHALACMAEYSLDEKVLAFCFDGTGYGDDGTLWGGEVFVASTNEYKRIYNFKQLSLLGGEKAVREPRRVGLSLLFECFNLEDILEMSNKVVDSFSESEIKTFHKMYKRNINSPKSTSLGRLFDAVYSLSGNTKDVGYEGESGLILESMSKKSNSNGSYKYNLKNGVVDYKEMICEILQEDNANDVAKKFLNTLVKIIVDICNEYMDMPILFSGGVFQNRVLVKELTSILKKRGRAFYIQQQTPVNDGGISLGQAYYAIKKYSTK
jgi:hydrogenase maturation protein HypF